MVSILLCTHTKYFLALRESIHVGVEVGWGGDRVGGCVRMTESLVAKDDLKFLNLVLPTPKYLVYGCAMTYPFSLAIFVSDLDIH